MEDFLRSSVERYKELTGVTVLRNAPTPFLAEPSKPSFDDPDAFRTKNIDIDEELRKAADPDSAEPNLPKQLNQYAAKILMKLLYAARYARFDLLRPICGLAQFITKWDERCDKRLYRLMCYVNSSLHIRMTGWIGDGLTQLTPHVFADADFAGCPTTSRSTSGMHHALLGPHSSFPIAGQSRKQGCVSHSTPEAEVVAADNALRSCGLPALHLWDKLLRRAVVLEFHEDNSTAVTTMKHGYSPAMKHLERTHGVCLRWLAERFIEPQCHLFYERTALMAADIYTKAFSTPHEWDHALRLVNHIDPVRFWTGRPKGPQKHCTDHMGSKHKGGVVFDYWTPNPWHGRASLDVPVPEGQGGDGPVLPAAPCHTQPVHSHSYADLDDDFDEDDDRRDCEDYASSSSGEEHKYGCEYESANIHTKLAAGDQPYARRRRIVEFCTNLDSRLGRVAPPNCDVIRLTIDDDLTTNKGLNKALAAVSDPDAQVLLFAAIPCTGGSQWQNLNWGRGQATQEKIRGHRDTFERLFTNFVKVAAACDANCGHIAIEWPRACSYWSLNVVSDFVRKHSLIIHDFDGCMYGLCSTNVNTPGDPIKKPWRIASNLTEFSNLRRKYTHQPSEHVPCAGVDTKRSEGYTDELATSIHRCFASHACSSGGSAVRQPEYECADGYAVDF